MYGLPIYSIKTEGRLHAICLPSFSSLDLIQTDDRCRILIPRNPGAARGIR